MCQSNARSNNLFYLRAKLAVDIELAFREHRQQLARPIRQFDSRRQCPTLHEHQVASDIERWRLAREPNRVFKCVSIRHQRRRRKYPGTMSMNDAGVHTPREAEV